MANEVTSFYPEKRWKIGKWEGGEGEKEKGEGREREKERGNENEWRRGRN